MGIQSIDSVSNGKFKGNLKQLRTLFLELIQEIAFHSLNRHKTFFIHEKAIKAHKTNDDRNMS